MDELGSDPDWEDEYDTDDTDDSDDLAEATGVMLQLRDGFARSRIERSSSSLEIVDPTTLPEDERECAICRQIYGEPIADDDGELAARLPCAGRHVFGLDCLKRVFVPSRNRYLNCPIRREGSWLRMVNTWVSVLPN